MRTDAAVCPRGGGRPRGSAPGNPGRGAASTLRKARAALAGASRPLTRRRVFSGGLPPKKTLGRIVKDGGILGGATEGLFLLYIGTDFLRAASPPVESLGKVGGGGPGGEGGSPSSEGLPPSSPGTSHLPLSGCPALAPFGDDSPLLLAERQELVGQQRIGEGKVGTLMHTA